MESMKVEIIFSDESDSLESRFTELCKNVLSMDEKTFSQAMELLRGSKHILLANMSSIGNEAPQKFEQFWFAFMIHTVKRLNMKDNNEQGKHESVGCGVTLCQILRATKLNIVDYFKEMPQFILRVDPIMKKLYGEDWEKRFEARELQANFVHLSLLCKFYKRAYQDFFWSNDKSVDNEMTVAKPSEYVSDYYHFGWLLFLSLRIHAFSRYKDLVTCTNGLVSILAILLLHVPVRLRKFSIQESPRFVRKGSKGVDLVASLCNIYNSSEDELRRIMEQANNLITGILKKKPCLAPECKTQNLDTLDTDGLTHFEDLMEESSLSSSLILLEKDYENAIQNKGDLDERVFVNDEDSLLGTGSLSGGAMKICGAKRKFDAVSSPTKSISSRPPSSTSPTHADLLGSSSDTATTSVSMAMTTAKWLETVICPLSSKPSAELERFLLSCDKAVTSDVVHRAQIILEAIFPSCALGEPSVSGSLPDANMMDNIWAEQRRMETLKLYYRVLEAMCTAEAQMLHDSNLTSLLTNERFHRCMLACSAELVLATRKNVTLLLPTVLQRTGITSFDLSKVIESFIRHEESLPRELRRHLNVLEEKLLESIVWEKGSSMYNSLIFARPALSSEINRLGLLAEPMPSLDAVAMLNKVSSKFLPSPPYLHNNETSPGQNGDPGSPKKVGSDNRSVLMEHSSFASPVKDRPLAFKNFKSKSPSLQSVFSSPNRPAPGRGGETCAETAINVFFSKIVKLAAVRINVLIERLQMSQNVRETVYRLIQQILSRQTALFFNRHIDQIILCSLYGVAKISQLKVTFREIIYSYRKLPNNKPQVFRSVFVDWSSVQGNGKIGQEHVDIITFYNEIFVPAVKPLLVELGLAGSTLRTNRSEVNNKADGQCPVSPKLTLFPSLPDMSPKKVSGARSVYVSPLGSSKMDALGSQGSKSLYACVGESTDAYRSPSKDLTVINKRLNSKKINNKLTFDDVGLVSHPRVALNLDLQLGSSVSSSSSASFELPVKSKQPDS